MNDGWKGARGVEISDLGTAFPGTGGGWEIDCDLLSLALTGGSHCVVKVKSSERSDQISEDFRSTGVPDVVHKYFCPEIFYALNCRCTFSHLREGSCEAGIRQGMWGCVKNMQPGLRKYQALRGQGKPPSNCARMARINTKVPTTFVRNLSLLDTSILETYDNGVEKEKSKGGHLRWFILGGALALACGVDRGAVGKVLVFGLARTPRRLGRLGWKAELVT
ncbi:hypothetical protein R1sor_013431 [Riccia sorocarpa]|uniref:Uncharacterized protein n=1 Tax=Riccia sorocarpa TaxID=122646 RepID=A0ABD3H6J3_9MARC